MTFSTLQRFVRRCDHVSNRPIHFCIDKPVFSAVLQTSYFHTRCNSFIPVIVPPIGIFVLSEQMRNHQGVIHTIVGLNPCKTLDRPDAGIRIVHVSKELVDTDHFTRVDLVWSQRVWNLSVEPDILWNHVIFKREFSLVPVIDHMTILILNDKRFSIFAKLSGLWPIPTHFCCNAAASEFRNMASLAGNFFTMLIKNC